MLATIFIFLALVILLIIFYNFYYKRLNLPPGPTPLPIIGNLLDIKNLPREEDCYIEWRKKYGDIFTYWLGEIPVVCFGEYKKIMETFQKDGETFAGKLFTPDFEKVFKGGIYGVIITEGDIWREQRRFALHVLRDFGLGKNLMEERVLNEFVAMANQIDQDIVKNVEINIPTLIDIATGSIINVLLFGYRFDEVHLKEFHELKSILLQFFMQLGSYRANFIMWKPNVFKNLPYFRDTYEKIMETGKVLFGFFEHHIQKHSEEIDFNDLDSPATDYVEAFLKEKAKRDKLNEKHNYTIPQLTGMCFDLWVAGQETTSTTLAWGFANLLNKPDVIKKLHDEMDNVIGNDRLINVSDRPNLPYTNAVINEIQRTTILLPQNLVHRTTKDTVVDGYFLPKGTNVVAQISTVLIDENIFENPKLFYPERFLDESGKLKRVDELVAFSIGKRQCLGESLARMELFLFLANLFNQYKISPGNKIPTLDRIGGAAIPCPGYTCRFEKRH